VLIEQAGQPVGQLKRLRRLGIKIALERFGLGVFVLGQCVTLPLDELKISPSVVEQLG
jgi:EAL domain-containing protein (putative c-di-GMP-specific phosphodiesterase class I)